MALQPRFVFVINLIAMKKNNRSHLKSCLLIFVLLGITTVVKGQSIMGKVTEHNGNGVPFVNVLLLNSSDSALVKAAVTDTAGLYHIEKIQAGAYLISARMVGYKQAYTSPVYITDGSAVTEIPVITITVEATQLGEVTVTGQRPFVEQEIDRTIVNVANSIIAGGSTALEVLEKAPGVTVDRQNDQVQLKGKDGVIIQINGKQTHLASQEVVALLRGTNSDNIDKIELITNPSARYDAAGNSGIINIVMKKENNLGTNGMVSIAGGAGRYARGRGSIQLNHRGKRFTAFANYGVGYNGNYFDFRTERAFGEGEKRNFAIQNTFLRTPDFSQNAKAGIEFNVSKASSIGFLWTGFWNNRDEDGLARSSFSPEKGAPVYLDAQTHKSLSSTLSNQVANFNLQHKFSNNGGVLTADVDFGWFDRRFINNLITNTDTAAEPDPTTSGLLIEMPSEISLYTIKSDYVRAVFGNWRMETGAKFSSVTSENNLKVREGDIGNIELNPALGNHFKFREEITAGYINMSGKLSDKTDLQAGLRIEQTESTANSISTDRLVKRNYMNYFPSIFISTALSKKQTLALTYSRRIDRPNYQNLNPGRSYVDPYFYSEGNPFLRPQYTHSVEVKHGINSSIFTSLAASYTDEYIAYFVQPADSVQSLRTPVNTGASQVYSASLSFPLTVAKAWTMQATIVGLYARYQFMFLGTMQRREQLTARLTVSNAIVLGKGWSLEASGWINAPAVNALTRSPWLGSADAGLQKTLGAKLKARLTVQDIFHTNHVRSRVNAAGFVRITDIDFDTRVALLNLTYNFGNQKLKSVSQRKTGSEDELKRTN